MIVDAPFQIYHLIGEIAFLLSANLRNPSCLQGFQDVKLENPHPISGLQPGIVFLLDPCIMI